MNSGAIIIGDHLHFTIPSVDEIDLPPCVYELARRGLLKFNPERTTAQHIVMTLTAKGKMMLRG